MDRAGPAEREGAAAQARPASNECLSPEFVADMLRGGDPARINRIKGQAL